MHSVLVQTGSYMEIACHLKKTELETETRISFSNVMILLPENFKLCFQDVKATEKRVDFNTRG